MRNKLLLHSRAVPSVEEHHCLHSPDTVSNSRGRQIKNQNYLKKTFSQSILTKSEIFLCHSLQWYCLFGLKLTFVSFCFRGPYTWECNAGVELKGGHEVEGRCVKKLAGVGGSNPVQGLFACKMTCGKFGTLWPQPTGDVVLSKDLVTFQLDVYLNCSIITILNL